MSFPAQITARTYLSCISTALAAIPLLYMVFRSINQSCSITARSKSNVGKVIPACTVLSLISFTLMLIFSFVVFLAVIIVQEVSLTADRLINASWIFYAIGIWIMMFIYVLRLDITFKNGPLSYPKWLINLLYGSLIIFGILCVTIVSLALSGFLFTPIHLYTSIITLILYIGFTLTLMFLFCTKLFIIMSKRLESKMNENKSNDAENENVDGIVIELFTLNSMIKYCLLVLQGIISTYIGNILVVIALTDQNLPPYAFVAVDILVNSMSLYFMFSFNNDQYNRCCSKCHGCFATLCIAFIFERDRYRKKLSLADRQQYESLIFQ